MENSLRSKIKKLYHDNNISEKMCNELLEKLEEHDRELRAKVIDEFAEALNKKISEFVLEHKDNLDFASGISAAWNMVDEIWLMKSQSG